MELQVDLEGLNATQLRVLQLRSAVEQDLDYRHVTYIFADVRNAKAKLDNAARLVGVDAPSVTDRHALAAHSHWHRRTNGVWAEFVDDLPHHAAFVEDGAEWPDPSVPWAGACDACGNVFLEGQDDLAFCPNCGRKRELDPDLTGTSGKLVALKRTPQKERGPGDGGFSGPVAGVAVMAPVSLTIVFANKFMQVTVDFEVMEISHSEFEVTVLHESRKMYNAVVHVTPQVITGACSNRNSTSNVRLEMESQDLQLVSNLRKELVNTRDAVARVRTGDLVYSNPGSACRRAAKKNFARG